jgi:hypothetical protein
VLSNLSGMHSLAAMGLLWALEEGYYAALSMHSVCGDVVMWFSGGKLSMSPSIYLCVARRYSSDCELTCSWRTRF